MNSSSTPPRPRRRMELSIRFLLRASQAGYAAPRPLQIRLTMDGVTISDYPSGIRVRPNKWHQGNQLVTGRTKSSEEINERLAEIEIQHRDILREL